MHRRAGAHTRTENHCHGKLVVLYKAPRDAAFDAHYREVHTPLVKKIPGLIRFIVSRGPVVSPSGPSGIHFVATLEFPDMETMQRALASPEAQAATADAGTFFQPGDSRLLFDDHAV